MTTANTHPAEKIGVLCQKLKEMRMSGMAAELEKQAEEPNTDLIPAEEVQPLSEESFLTLSAG